MASTVRHSPTVECIYTSETIPEYSIVMPIHNQADIIKTVLNAVLLHTQGQYELILVFDGCTDNSKNIALELVPTPNMTRFLAITNKFGLFEASADNQGFMMSRGEYIVEIQADMVMQTPGYNEILCKPMRVFNDLIAVSGRCCHRIEDHSRGVGKLGLSIEHPHSIPPNGNTIFISHTVNRGPLAIRRSMLVDLNYLDEDHYVQDYDDHDLFARAWVQHKWKTAFYPVEFASPLAWGSNRKPRLPHVASYLATRRKNEKNGFFAQYEARGSFPQEETRYLNIV